MAAKKGAVAGQLQLSPEEIEELDRPKRVLATAVESGDLGEVWAYGQALNKVGTVAGLNKAQLVAGIRREWPALKAKGAVEDDVENVVQAYLGLTPANFKKYADAWERLVDEDRIPSKHMAAWMRKPVEHFLAISAAAVDGLTPAQWEKVTLARQVADVKEVVRSVRGSKTSAGSRRTIQVKRKTGVLRAWKGKGKPVEIGLLKIDSEDAQVKEFVDWVINQLHAVVE